MAGPLLHSPACILQAILVARGLGASPPNLIWPIYIDSQPDLPDNLISVLNEIGKDYGRVQINGERLEHHGVTVSVRAGLSPLGYSKARQIAIVLDSSIYFDEVSIESSSYLVYAVTRTSDVVYRGKESETSKRGIHSMTAVLALKQLT
jgi:hypothetical protein